MILILMLWVLFKCSLSAWLLFDHSLIALWSLSDLERWRLTALDRFVLHGQTDGASESNQEIKSIKIRHLWPSCHLFLFFFFMFDFFWTVMIFAIFWWKSEFFAFDLADLFLDSLVGRGVRLSGGVGGSGVRSKSLWKSWLLGLLSEPKNNFLEGKSEPE